MNLISQLITSTGTSTLTLGTSINDFGTLADIAANGDRFYYTLKEGENYEVGYGTYVSAGNLLTRDVIFETIESGIFSPAGTPINLAGGLNASIALTNTLQSAISHAEVFKRIYADLNYNVANLPAMASLVGTINVCTFGTVSLQQLGLGIPVPTDIIVGSSAELCIHWNPTSANAGNVRWGIEVAQCKENSGAFSSATTHYVDAAAQLAADRLQIDKSSTLLTDLEPNSMVMGRIFRDYGHANDTYADTAQLLGVSLLYKSRRVGTPQETSPYDWA